MRTSLVGFGGASQVFHAPLLQAVCGVALCAVVSTQPDKVGAQLPGVPVLPSLDAALSERADIELVVVATSNDSHYPLARQALLAGRHVVVDKPCTVRLEETLELLALARRQQRIFTVFQNRRWDADFLALRAVLESGTLGRAVYLESHFDRYRPVVPQRWREQDLPGSGLWMDLGSHLVDQALQLFGLPQDVLLDLGRQRDGAVVNDYFHAVLRYPQHQDLRVVLHGATLVAQCGPRFVLHGTQGSYTKQGLDTQEQALKDGLRPPRAEHLGASTPASGTWGLDPEPGHLLCAAQPSGALLASTQACPAGHYPAFYAQLAQAIRHQGTPPVTPQEVENAMRVLCAGQMSAQSGAFVRPDLL
ncbi:MAG: oxidoreductase [Rhodoferax sp.]